MQNCPIHGNHERFIKDRDGSGYCRICRAEYKKVYLFNANFKHIRDTYSLKLAQIYRAYCEKKGRTISLNVFYKYNAVNYHLDTFSRILEQVYKRTLNGESLDSIIKEFILDNLEREENVRNLRQRYLSDTSIGDIQRDRNTGTNTRRNVRDTVSSVP